MERAACIANLPTYIGFRAGQFIGDAAPAGVTIRKPAGDVTDAFGTRISMARGDGAKAASAARQSRSNLREPGGPPS
jgi:hypothetical protein